MGLGQLGKGKTLCHSVAPASPDARCLLQREAHYPEGLFHRVVPSGSGGVVDFVWGTCDAAPRSHSWCESPSFDVEKVARACGVAAAGSGAAAGGVATAAAAILGANHVATSYADVEAVAAAIAEADAAEAAALEAEAAAAVAGDTVAPEIHGRGSHLPTL